MKRKSRPNSDARFKKIKRRYEEFCANGNLIQDEKVGFYIYRQLTKTHSFTGVICGVDVSEYATNHIKIHEQTLTSRVEVFTKYLDICNFNAEPVLLTYRDEAMNMDSEIEKSIADRAEYDFTTTDGVRHQLWPVTDAKLIANFIADFAQLHCLYIADGHHRMASSTLLGEKRRKQKNWKPSDISNYSLALILPERELNINPFHRVIQLDEIVDEREILNPIRTHFEVKKVPNTFFPKRKHEFGLRLASGWYRLILKDKITSDNAVDHLDPMVLTQNILKPVFQIHDQKTDRRITFIPGKQNINKIEKSIDEGLTTALFTLFPLTTDQIFAVSDAGEIMPPKSTFVEPKLRSGLTIMDLSGSVTEG